MIARDLAVPIYRYLQPETTLKEAVNIFQTTKRGEGKMGVKGLPVLDSCGTLVGMLSMQDILKAIHPSYMDMMNLSNFTWDGMVEEMARKVADRKVSEVMNKTVLTVHENDPLMECVDLMLKNCVPRLLVVDAAGKVVGMIYERDVFYAVVKAMIE
jgi:predicted transcriptional regulator